MTHYHAGWSLPGCLPEMDPATFATEREGEAFIEDERRSVAESFDDDYVTEDPYIYWVDPCADPACVIEP